MTEVNMYTGYVIISKTSMGVFLWGYFYNTWRLEAVPGKKKTTLMRLS